MDAYRFPFNAVRIAFNIEGGGGGYALYLDEGPRVYTYIPSLRPHLSSERGVPSSGNFLPQLL